MTTSFKVLAVAGTAALFINPANATLIVTAGAGSTTVSAVSVAGCSSLNKGPATTVIGCLSNDHTTAVQFHSADENIKIQGGAAIVKPATGFGINDLEISISGHDFTELSLDIVAHAVGTVTFLDNLGDLVPAALVKGNNIFDLTGSTFSFITFTTTDATYKTRGRPVIDGDVTSVRQVRFGSVCTVGEEGCGPGGNNVPEPSTTALLGAGLLGFAFFGRFRRRANPQA
jgi:hypothetical protein